MNVWVNDTSIVESDLLREWQESMNEIQNHSNKFLR
jgi:hypothetical protein